jgi:RNA-directed DNA polymerase
VNTLVTILVIVALIVVWASAFVRTPRWKRRPICMVARLIVWAQAFVQTLRWKRRPIRNVATLAGTDDASLKEEVITTSGPLKPNHRRLTVRDQRLLPKPAIKVERYVWPRPKKARIFTKAEANRLFSATLRTHDRNIRDLATDREQLARYGLPIWESEADLAAALSVTLGQLQHYSIHRERERASHYVCFAVPKRSGGERLIYAPKRRLKRLQRLLHQLLVRKLPFSAHAHGFVSGRSIATNAAPHVGKSVVLKFDIKDCFPTIHFGRVRGLLVALGYSYPLATTLAVLMTEAPRQPFEIGDALYHVPIGSRVCVQGAPTSPGLCNAVMLKLDRRLAGLAKAEGFAYTRYADDLTFSGDNEEAVERLLARVPRIVEAEGFALNAAKTRLMRRGGRQRVTGVVVNKSAGPSRQERRRLRAEIHRLSQNAGAPERRAMQRLRGKLAYLRMLNPVTTAPLVTAFQNLSRRG